MTKHLTLTGVGAGFTIVQAAASRAAASDRVFNITGGVHVTLTEMTVRYGNPPGAIAQGGGVYVDRDLTLDHTDVVSNTAAYGGGASAEGNAFLNGGRFQDNQADWDGGGLFVSDGDLHMDGTEFVSNTCGTNSSGGGAYVYDDAYLQDGLFLQNAAGWGGGLLVDVGDLHMTGTQFISNTATGNFGGYGGGAAVYDGDATLNGGLFRGNVVDNSYGGGLLVYGGELHMVDTQFISNTAQSDQGGGAWVWLDVTLSGGSFKRNTAAAEGGGLYVDEGTLHMTATEFISNSADKGGGAFVGAREDEATVDGGLFQENHAAKWGGGLLVKEYNTLYITGTQFISNTAGEDGGGFEAAAGVCMTDVELIRNSASNEGGGAWVRGGGTAKGVLFEENYAGSEGGGLYACEGSLDVTQSRFVGNRSGGAGGGIRHNGASSVVNTLFARNAATSYGAAMSLSPNGVMTLMHNTIVSPTVGAGAAIHVGSGTVGITNTIVASYTTAISVSGGTVSEDYSLFYPGTMVTGTGTIAHGSHSLIGDPLFVDPSSDDYHLSTGSPAIDSGTNLGVFVDLDGNPRPMDLGYERGCYEVPGAIGGDLEMSKLGLPVLVVPGGTLQYKVTCTSRGAAATSEVWISDTLPPGTTYGGQVDGSPGWTGPNVSGQVVSWYTPTLDADGSATFVITATVGGGAISSDWVLTNTVEVTATVDLTPTNNLSQATSVVQGLQIGKSHFPQPVTAAWSFWYYIDVTNTASAPATNLVISDTLPAEVAPYSVQPDMGGVFDGVNTVVWTIPSLGPNTTVRVSIKARTYSTAAGKCFTNWASADSDQAAPPVSASDTACVVAGELEKPTPTPTPTPTPAPLPGTVVAIQSGLGGDNPDTFIYRYAANANYHMEPLLKVGYKQTHAALLRFDLSAIPAGSTIDAAWLQVYAAGWSGPGADITVGAYAISPTVEISETTWNEAYSGDFWTGAGCSDTLFDRREVPESRLTTSGPLKWYRFDLTGLVQDWFSGALPNNGVLLRQDVYGLFTYFFASAEYPDVEVRPKLVVRYQ